MKTMPFKNLAAVALTLAAALSAPRAHAASAAWNVDGNATWSANASWSPAAAPGNTSGDNTDIATFSLPLTAASTVTVDTGRYIGGISFGNNSTKGYTLSGGSINLNNGGVIQTLSTDGVHAETISSAIKIDGGSGSTATFTAGAANGSANFAIGAVTGSAATGGLTTLTLNGTRVGATSSMDTISGIIGNGSGGGKLAIIKDGAGTWYLTAGNTFSGGLTIKAGTLTLGTSPTAGGNGTIYLGDTAATGANATLTLYNTNSFANVLTVQSGSSGTKTIRNSTVGANPTYNGTITMNDNLTAIGGGSGSLTFGTGATINLNANTLTLNGGTLTCNGVISGSGNVTQAAAGTSTLNAANTFTGVTKVSAGTLSLGNAFALQNSVLDTANSIVGNATAGLKTNQTALTLGGLTGNKDLSTVFTTTSGGYSGNLTALTINPGTGVTNSYSGNITDGAAGMTLTKNGNGTQILSGNNLYTGTTTVSAGTLLVDVGHTGAGAYSVSSGGTLGGTGSITTAANAGIMFTDGAALSPGDNSASNLTFALGLGVFDISAMATNSKLLFTLGTNSDKLTLTTGTLSIGTLNSGEFAFTLGTGFGAGTYTLFHTAATITATSLDIATFALDDSYNGNLQYGNSNQDIQLLVTAVPEPATWALLAFSLTTVMVLRRRRNS